MGRKRLLLVPDDVIQGAALLDRSNLRLLLSRQRQPPKVLGFVLLNPHTEELKCFVQLLRGNEFKAENLYGYIFNFSLLVTDGAYPPLTATKLFE